MGPTRLLAGNLLTADVVTPSEVARGRVTALRKDGTGSATLIVAGAYSGLVDLDYYVEVQAAGDTGTATFKWSEDDGATFVATGVATSEAPIALSNGLTVAFIHGSGQDCDAGDVWRWRAYLPHGPAAMLDRDRDTEYRSDGVGPLSLTFDFGEPVTPTVLALLDHNLRAETQLRIDASADNFVTVPVRDPVRAVAGEPLVHYIGAPARTYRYWRLSLSDAGHPDGYLRWSEAYLGTYLETSRRHESGDAASGQRVITRDRAVSGRWVGAVPEIRTRVEVQWSFLTEDDREALFDVFAEAFDPDRMRTRPCWVHLDSDDPASILLAEWAGGSAQSRNIPQAPERYGVSATFVEVPRTI
jgi:hypothetical protein